MQLLPYITLPAWHVRSETTTGWVSPHPRLRFNVIITKTLSSTVIVHLHIAGSTACCHRRGRAAVFSKTMTPETGFWWKTGGSVHSEPRIRHERAHAVKSTLHNQMSFLNKSVVCFSVAENNETRVLLGRGGSAGFWRKRIASRHVNDTLLLFRGRRNREKSNGGISAIDPTDYPSSEAGRGHRLLVFVALADDIRVSSHIDACTLFNCSSDTRSRQHFGTGSSNMFFRFC